MASRGRAEGDEGGHASTAGESGRGCVEVIEAGRVVNS